MADAVEYPDIRHVVYPMHMNGTLTGANPRKRHEPGCGHFRWPGGILLGTPVRVTDEQMLTLRACKSCIKSLGG